MSSEHQAPVGPQTRMVIGRNPEGTIDRAVDVIRVDDLEGATLATMLSAACHPIVLGPTCDGWHQRKAVAGT